MSSINDKLNYLDDTKSAIKSAIQDKGITINEDDTFRSYAEKIQLIETSSLLEENREISKSITTNGVQNYNILPTEPYEGMKAVNINIDVNVPDNIMDEPLVITPNKEIIDGSQDPQYDVYEGPFEDSSQQQYNGVSNVKVRKIGSWIDSEISSDNIRVGHTILGVAGNVIELLPEQITVKSSNQQQVITPSEGKNGITSVTVSPLTLEQKTVSPSKNQFTVFTSSGYDGMSQVTVNAVTSDVDSNITPENIKKDISILGVTGSYEPEPYISEELTISPTTSLQTFIPDEGVDGFNNVTVNAVTSSIDSNIIPKNIKRGITILGVDGNYVIENLQDKVVNPSINQQEITFDDGYEGLNKVTINAVTSSIDPDIKAENIKEGVEILGVTGNYEGKTYNIEPAKTVDPKTTSQIVEPSEGYDALSSVNINAVTSSIDANILAENIKKNISILGVTGNYEGKTYSFQEKEVEPAAYDKTITADSNYDALIKVIVKAVTASIDSNIIPENIKKNISILGVMGTLETGESHWFDFSGIKNVFPLNELTLGLGGNKSCSQKLTENNFEFKTYINDKVPPLTNINAALFSEVIGFNESTHKDSIYEQLKIYFSKGGYYSDYITYVPVNERLCYFYPFENNFNVDGCLINYNDTGSEVKLNMYILTGGTKPVCILTQGNLSNDSLPDTYTGFRYISELTIPQHKVYEPRLISKGEMLWVPAHPDQTTPDYNIIMPTMTTPLNIDFGSYDTNYNYETQEYDVDEYKPSTIEDFNFNIIGNNINIDENKIATGFNSSSYLQSNVSLTGSNIEITSKVYVVGGGNYNILFGNKNVGYGVNGSTSYRYWRIWNGAENLSARYGYTNNSTYWVKLYQSSSQTKLLTILDDGTYQTINDLPPYNDDKWTTQITLNSTLFSGNDIINIGNGYSTLSEYWRGNIDLNNFEIKTDAIIWTPYSIKSVNLTSHNIIPAQNELYIKRQERNVLTSLQYVNQDMNESENIISYKSDKGKLLFEQFTTEQNDWEMQFHIRTPENLNNRDNIILDLNEDYGTRLWCSTDNNFKIYISSKKDKDVCNFTLCPFELNQEYYINIRYLKGIYIFKIAKDKLYQNLILSKSITGEPIYNTNHQFCLLNSYVYDQNNIKAFGGNLDTSDSYIKIGNEFYWAKNYLITNGLIVGDYEDNGEERNSYIYAINDNGVKTYVISDDESFASETVINLGKVGNINIPAHTYKYDYENGVFYPKITVNLNVNDENTIIYTEDETKSN